MKKIFLYFAIVCLATCNHVLAMDKKPEVSELSKKVALLKMNFNKKVTQHAINMGLLTPIETQLYCAPHMATGLINIWNGYKAGELMIYPKEWLSQNDKAQFAAAIAIPTLFYCGCFLFRYVLEKFAKPTSPKGDAIWTVLSLALFAGTLFKTDFSFASQEQEVRKTIDLENRVAAADYLFNNGRIGITIFDDHEIKEIIHLKDKTSLKTALSYNLSRKFLGYTKKLAEELSSIIHRYIPSKLSVDQENNIIQFTCIYNNQYHASSIDENKINNSLSEQYTAYCSKKQTREDRIKNASYDPMKEFIAQLSEELSQIILYGTITDVKILPLVLI